MPNTIDPSHSAFERLPEAPTSRPVAGWECAKSVTPLPLVCRTSTLAAVSSLWTPDGEHKVPRPGEPGPEPPGGDRGPGPGPRDSGSRSAGPADLSAAGADGGPTDAELRELARQLAAAPPEDVIANHCYGLFELAALHLSQQPPRLDAARLAIDAMGLVIEGLGGRLGAHAATLADGLTQLRLAFVRISDAPTGSATAAEGPAAATDAPAAATDAPAAATGEPAQST